MLIQPKSWNDGEFWRAVINFVNIEPFTPLRFLPLIEMILDRWKGAPELSLLTEELSTAKARKNVARAACIAEIGQKVWDERHSYLINWISKYLGTSFTEDEVYWWWWWSHVFYYDNLDKKFKDLLQLKAEFIREVLEPGDRKICRAHDIRLSDLYRLLSHITELESLSDLAKAAWPSGGDPTVAWDRADFQGLSAWAETALCVLRISGDREKVDPQTLLIGTTFEPWLGETWGELDSCLFLIICHTVSDFVLERSYANIFPNMRGALHCKECGQFVSRSSARHTQKYCSTQCKKRAAKRRYRSRHRHKQKDAKWKKRC